MKITDMTYVDRMTLSRRPYAMLNLSRRSAWREGGWTKLSTGEHLTYGFLDRLRLKLPVL